jgi:hypothetical protein
MDLILEQSFEKASVLNDKEFLNITEHNHSELFLYVRLIKLKNKILDIDFLIREETVF